MGNNNLISSKKTYYISIAILAGMFFIFGFVSWVNAILIPYFRISCELTHFESYFVAFAFYIAYFVMAIPSGVLLKKVGFKRGIMYGFMLTALGAFLFVPAALARQFEIFLAGLFSIGTGLAILQTAANPYVTIIGPIDSAAKRISIMGICNKFAGIVSPLIFAALILNVTDKELFATIESGTLDIVTKNAMLDELIQRVIVPYAFFICAKRGFSSSSTVPICTTGPKRPILTETVLPVPGSSPRIRSPTLCSVLIANVFSTDGWNLS